MGLFFETIQLHGGAGYLLVQGIGLLGTGLYFVSYQFKNNRRLFQIQFLSYLCYTLHLLLLGAFTGGISYLINMMRSFCLGSKYEFLKSRQACAVICLLQVLALYFTWGGWLSLLPVTANIAATLGGYTHDAKKIRWVGILVNSPLWIIYDIIVGSWAGILDEVASEVSMLVSLRKC